MTRWIIRWLTAGYCEYYAAFLIMADRTDTLGAANIDLEEGFYGRH